MREKLEEMYSVNVHLVEGDGGVFEITHNSTVIFSKDDLRRFPTDDDLAKLNLVAVTGN